MMIALVQLSDIHLKAATTANPVLDRAAAVVRAVASVCPGVKHGVLIVSGDTAFSGKEGEYEHGRNLITGIQSGLMETLGSASIPVLTIAGNHDCDFGLGNKVREILLGTLKAEQIDASVIEQCSDVQRHYFTFAASVDPPGKGVLSTGIERLYRQTAIELGGKKLVFHLLNSAWMSQLHEKPGGLYFPVRLVKDRIAAAPRADIVVAAVHHPFNWYWPENAREFRQCLEDNSDLILTGHEHVPGAYGKRTDTGEQNDYLEGGVLQESGHPGLSSFNVVLFDVALGRQQTYRFVWKDDQYAPDGEPYWRPFERNKRLTRNQFELADQFYHWLEEPGAGYTHPLKDPLVLSDLFVYPDLQEAQYQREGSDRSIVSVRR